VISAAPRDRVTDRRRSGDAVFWVAAGAACVAICFAITNVSLWIDEGFTAWLCAHASIGSVVAALASPFQATAADRQYPLYVLWIWSWTHVFGSSEIALRSANAPFGVLYVLALALPCRHVFDRRFAWIPFAFAPFIWFYMNEARSYLMLASLATAVTAAAVTYAYGPQAFRPRAVWLLGAFGLLALLTNVLAVFLFPGLAVFAILTLRGSAAPRWREWRGPALAFGPLIALTLIFYAFTFLGGGGRNELRPNHRDLPGVAFAAQVLYEDAGFDGLGPPRNDLREQPTKIARPYAVLLLLGLSALAVAVTLALRNSRDPRYRPLLLGWIVSFVVAIAVSYALHTRFLGRHMAATLPLLLFALVALVRYRASLVLIAAVFLISDARLGLLPAYWKDDYRAAVRDVVARVQAAPGTIDWAADDRTANYYGLGLTYPGNAAVGRYLQVGWPEKARGVAVSLMRPQAVDRLLESQLALGKPVYLVLSKLDVFDTYGGWQQAIARYHPATVATYRAFTILRFASPER
jgi:MFS family permease